MYTYNKSKYMIISLFGRIQMKMEKQCVLEEEVLMGKGDCCVHGTCKQDSSLMDILTDISQWRSLIMMQGTPSECRPFLCANCHLPMNEDNGELLMTNEAIPCVREELEQNGYRHVFDTDNEEVIIYFKVQLGDIIETNVHDASYYHFACVLLHTRNNMYRYMHVSFPHIPNIIGEIYKTLYESSGILKKDIEHWEEFYCTCTKNTQKMNDDKHTHVQGKRRSGKTDEGMKCNNARSASYIYIPTENEEIMSWKKETIDERRGNEEEIMRTLHTRKNSIDIMNKSLTDMLGSQEKECKERDAYSELGMRVSNEEIDISLLASCSSWNDRTKSIRGDKEAWETSNDISLPQAQQTPECTSPDATKSITFASIVSPVCLHGNDTPYNSSFGEGLECIATSTPRSLTKKRRRLMENEKSVVDTNSFSSKDGTHYIPV